MSKEAKNDIKTAVFWAFLFMAGTFVISNFLPSYLPEQLEPFKTVLMYIIVCVPAVLLSRKSMPEGWLLGSRNTLSLRTFLFLLGLMEISSFINVIFVLPLSFLSESTMGKLAESFSSLDQTNGIDPTSLITLGFGAPIFEEIMFRGVVAGRMKKYGSVFFFIMSTVLFALQHANPIQLLTTILPGLILCYLASNYSIKWSILLHFINNCLLTLLLPVFVQGLPGEFLQMKGSYIIRVAVIIIGLLCGIGLKPIEKFKNFIHETPNEEGCWKAAFLNIWFVLMILIMAGVTAMIVLAVTLI